MMHFISDDGSKIQEIPLSDLLENYESRISHTEYETFEGWIWDMNQCDLIKLSDLIKAENQKLVRYHFFDPYDHTFYAIGNAKLITKYQGEYGFILQIISVEDTSDPDDFLYEMIGGTINTNIEECMYYFI